MDVMVMPDPLAVMEYLVFRDVNMIVIVEASRFRQSVLNELKCALDRYYSQTQLWSYLHKGEDGLPSITHYNGNAPVDQLPLPPVEVEISERIEEFNTSFDSIESDAEGSALLTQEELAMLIGAD